MKTESSVVSAVIGASGTVPLALAQANPEGGFPVWVLSISLTTVLAVLGYLLKRSWEQVDKTLEKLDARVGRVEDRLVDVERKL